MNPMLVDYINGDYHLSADSPCIDAGNPDLVYYDPDGTIADIGAYYFDQGSAAPVINDFTADPLTGNMPLVVQFTQDIAGPVTEYTWLFGDGGTSNLPNPVHVYSTHGIYDVALMVNGPGGSDTKLKAGYIEVLTPVPPLNAAFIGETLLGYAPLQVQFTDLSTGPVGSFLWDFGDGSSSTDQNPLHTYEIPGNYTVSLTVYSSSGEDTETKVNYIQVLEVQQVVAMFTTSGTNGAAPFTVGFFDQSFGTITSRLWDFGDGITSTQTNPVHTFTEPGEYLVSLTVFGPQNTDIAEETILVEASAPIITAITDRPNDQGGYVYICFKKSYWDGVNPSRSTESYTIQQLDKEVWVSLSSVLAYGQPLYTALAVTPHDSTTNNTGITTYRVIAGMDEGTWISEPAQGYSVDNIAPDPPVVLDYSLTENQIAFSWDQSMANDFDHFAIYKSDNGYAFPDDPYTVLTSTSFTDLVNPDEVWFYTVAAFDDDGNQSQHSEVVATLPRMEVNLPGGWSGISGNLEVYDTNVENLFAPVLDELIILQSETGMYWPGENINTIGNWQTNEGYKIKMSQPAQFSLWGMHLTDRSLNLSAGWNLIPILSTCETTVSDLFEGSSMIIIKEVAGWKLYWPTMGITSLSTLEPGKAYYVMMESEEMVTFPECTSP